MASLAKYREGYERNWARMQIRPTRAAEVDSAAKRLIKGKTAYKQIEAATGVPWWVIGLWHYRESNFNFRTYLGNGQSLDRKTTIVPKGRGPFKNFVEGGVDAIRLKGWTGVKDWSLAPTVYRLEAFNGFGYHGKGVNSPYLYGGSTVYGPPESKGGKYTQDHFFDSGHIDTQLGVLTILKRLMELDPSVKFTDGEEPTAGEQQLVRGTLWIQQSLNKLMHEGHTKLVEDGILGKLTMGALARFQKENGLEEDGLPDPETIAEIEKHLRGLPTADESKSYETVVSRVSLDDRTRAFLKHLFGVSS